MRTEDPCTPWLVHTELLPSGIDQAVAQAVQNLQSLQQRRVEIYSDLGFRTTSDPVPLPVYQVSQGQSEISVSLLAAMFYFPRSRPPPGPRSSPL